MSNIDQQREIRRKLEIYYEITPNKIRFDEHNRVIADGFVELLMGTDELHVDFAYVNGAFSAEGKGLKSLKGAPASVIGYFEIAKNRLTSLEGGPKVVGGDYYCHKNKLVNLIGAPVQVGADFVIYGNPLVSLEGMPKSIGNRLALSYEPNLPLLRTLVAPKIELNIGTTVVSYDRILLCAELLNRYAGQGRAGAIDCKRDLAKHGFEGNARW